MRNSALLVAGMVAVMAVAGCSDASVPSQSGPEQSLTSESLPATQSDTEGVEDVDGSPAPTVAAQAPGSPLAVAGAELAAPEGWAVSGVSSDDRSQVVSATSDAGQFISLRSVRSDAGVGEQIAEALAADAEQAVEAPDIEADGQILRGVETAVTTSGGQTVQLQYFIRRGDLLIAIDIVTSGAQRDAMLEHLASGLTWS